MSSPSLNETNYTGPGIYVGESIFLNTSGAPFLVFAFLSIILIVVTLIAIIVMIRQHDKHLKKINAVRGFHQDDIQQGNEILQRLEREHHQQNKHSGSNSSRSGSLRQSRSQSIAMGRRDTTASLGEHSFNSAASSSQQAGKGTTHSKTRMHRIIYDFHHTPPQPDLLSGADAASGNNNFLLDSGSISTSARKSGHPRSGINNNNNMPPLDLSSFANRTNDDDDDFGQNHHGSNQMASSGKFSPSASVNNQHEDGVPLAMASSNSGSFSPTSNRRGVGMRSFRK